MLQGRFEEGVDLSTELAQALEGDSAEETGIHKNDDGVVAVSPYWLRPLVET